MASFLTIPQIIVSHSRNYGNSLAVKDSDITLTYKQLNLRSNRLGHTLHRLVRAENEFVVILLDRSADAVMSQIGIAKAGCAFVPVPIDYPVDRINHILGDCEPKTVITTKDIFAQLPEQLNYGNAHIVFTDELDSDDSDIDLSKPDNYGAILYTFGSTGVPKGVVHNMKTLLYFAFVLSTTDGSVIWEMGKDKVAVISELNFIATLGLIYAAILKAKFLTIIPNVISKNAALLYDFFVKEQITVCFLPSQYGVALINKYQLPLRCIFLGGEQMPELLPGKPEAPLVVFNCYGMTEGFYTIMQAVHSGNYRPVIGPAVEPTKIYLLDEQGRQVPDGELGEICICSDYLFMAYHKLPELTAQVLVDCPFEEGKKMFCTGDLARRNADGTMIHCGRKDSMVKLRGLRIDTNEVEIVASHIKDISAAVCMKKVLGGGEYLCLYYESSKELDEKEIKTHLASKLADYMVPQFVIHMEKMPLTERGKIDRQALPEPVLGQKSSKVEAETEREKVIYKAVCKIMGTEDFGVTDDLFSLGLTSLECVMLSGELLNHNINIELSEFRTARTIRELAKKGPDNKYLPLTKVSSDVMCFPLPPVYIHLFKTNRDTFNYVLNSLDIIFCDTFPPGTSEEKVLQALKDLISSHAIYTSTVQIIDDCPCLYKSNVSVSIDLVHTEESKIEELQALYVNEVLNVYNELCRFKIVVTPQKIRLYCRFSHLITDLISSSLFHQELVDRYYGTEVQAEPFDIYDWTNYLSMAEKRCADKIAERTEKISSFYTVPNRLYHPMAICVPILNNSEYEQLKSFCNRIKQSADCVLLSAIAVTMQDIKNIVSPIIQYSNHWRNVPGSGSIHGNMTVEISIPTQIPHTSNLKELFTHFQTEYEYCVNNFISANSMMSYDKASAVHGILFNNRTGSYFAKKGKQSGIIIENLHGTNPNSALDLRMLLMNDCEDGLEFLILCDEDNLDQYKKIAADFRKTLLTWISDSFNN